jgi:hypothetical protein
MELVALIWGLAQIAGQTVGTGILTKVGENILDAASPKVRELYDVLLNKLPESPTTKAIRAGQELDYDRLITDVKWIESDPEVLKLADEIRSLIAQNKELQAKLDAEVAKVKVRAKNLQVNRDRSHGNIQVNDKVEAKYFGGTHYHGKDPD